MVHEQDTVEQIPEPAPMRILIVEDEPKTAAYVSKGLTEHAYVVDIAYNGIEGLHLATSGSYDLILLDVMLPGADGWSVLEALRRKRQTPVLFLSARHTVDGSCSSAHPISIGEAGGAPRGRRVVRGSRATRE